MGLPPQAFSRGTTAPGAAPPPPSFLQGLSDSFWSAADQETAAAQDQEAMAKALSPLVDALHDRGVTGKFTKREARDAWAKTYDAQAIWDAVDRVRQSDPTAFTAIPHSLDEFRAKALGKVQAERESRAASASRAGTATRLIGGFGYGATDPINTVGMMLGAGEAKTVAQAVVNEAVVNARLTAMSLPGEAWVRASQGRDMTLGDAAAELGTAVVGGALFGGALKGLELHGGPAAGKAYDTALNGVWHLMPEPVKRRWADAASVSERDLPDLADMVLGDGADSETRAAIHALRQQDALDEANPFKPNGAGVQFHRERFAETLSRVLDDLPPQAPRAEGVTMPGRADTALGTGTVPMMPARAAVKNRIGVVESALSNNAANPLSSARGKYQFIESTWLHYYKRRFGDQGLSDAQILAKRSDGAVQDVLMDDLTDDNAAFLRSHGESESAGNLYLVHFAGQGGAKRLFEADPGARAADILGAKVANANPFLKDMSAGDLIAWAHHKMGGAVPERAGARVELRDDIGGEAALRERLQADIDRITAERDAIERTGEQAEARADGSPDTPSPLDAPIRTDEAAPVLVDGADRVPFVSAKWKRRTLPTRTRPSDVIEFLADRGGVRDDAGHDLRNRLDAFVPRAGPLVRKRGMSIDDAGELLHEAGFFTDRPSEADVLDMLERAVNGSEKIYQLHHAADMAERDQAIAQDNSRSGYLERLQAETDFHPEHDADLTDDVLSAMAEGYDPWSAMERVITERMDNARQRALEQSGDSVYGGDYADEWVPGFDDAQPANGKAGAGSARGTGASAGSGTARPLGEADRGAPGESLTAEFVDPQGTAAKAQTDNLDHDARAQLDAFGEQAGDQRRALERQGEGRIKGKVPQKPVGSDGGLFDSAAQDMEFRFDADGEGQTLRDLYAALDAEEAEINEIRNCL
ncbi:hypothetical protein [Stakelama pacifica]|uniref:Uncharacterized protein n=1 Tax=Stakelama pacifica TaxID=517720 RepID=A0A4R6FMZ2_9SPHN|nr:hypothetical protein [Stakelama pacifica]TDN82969.1 hypothetical protein EV664_105167 [Stakelama pacifica]GGO95048.1 hypothetical protein GCM10011329_18310 [Stakelama pacifica]